MEFFGVQTISSIMIKLGYTHPIVYLEREKDRSVQRLQFITKATALLQVNSDSKASSGVNGSPQNITRVIIFGWSDKRCCIWFFGPLSPWFVITVTIITSLLSSFCWLCVSPNKPCQMRKCLGLQRRFNEY